MSQRLEIRVPISPTPNFFRRVHFMAASLRRLGGALADADILVYVGGDEEPQDLYKLLRWSRKYPIKWCWADREMFRRDSYLETSREVFRRPSSADYVMCADADIIFVRDFSEVLANLDLSPAVAGVIAHISPFANIANMDPSAMWQSLCEGYELPPPSFAYQHTGWGCMTTKPQDRFTPAYFNFGMVLMPCQMMDRIRTEIARADDFVNSRIKTVYRFQIALTLAIHKHRIPTRALPLRYNFPNDSKFDRIYPDDLKDLRILHYLRYKPVHRVRDFETLEAVAALAAREDLRGSNQALQEIIAELYPIVATEEEL